MEDVIENKESKVVTKLTKDVVSDVDKVVAAPVVSVDTSGISYDTVEEAAVAAVAQFEASNIRIPSAVVVSARDGGFATGDGVVHRAKGVSIESKDQT